jgi:hypothetical protein
MSWDEDQSCWKNFSDEQGGITGPNILVFGRKKDVRLTTYGL